MCDKKKKKQPLIRWLPNMKRVLYALVPLMLASIYFFGWRSLVLIVVVNIAGFLTEYIFLRLTYKEPVSSAIFVTNCLFVLTLPPTIPIWMAIVGIVFGIIFGKMVFGGFGRNVFNPAIVGRAFLYISFGVQMTSKWTQSATLGIGGITNWTTDAVTGATPLGLLSGKVQELHGFLSQGSTIIDEATHSIPSFLDMLIGNTSGCLGETSAILIIIGGLYLLFTKTANWRIVVGGIAGLVVMQSIFWLAKIPISDTAVSYDPLTAILTGGFLLGIFYMATDPISASGTDGGRWINGIMIGILTVLIRTFASWPEGMMFAILLANMFTPIMDYGFKELKKRKKAKAKPKEATS